jgi:hypothetical protein
MDACFIVRDATGQAVGHFYFEDEPGIVDACGGEGSAAFSSWRDSC